MHTHELEEAIAATRVHEEKVERLVSSLDKALSKFALPRHADMQLRLVYHALSAAALHLDCLRDEFAAELEGK